MTYAAILIDMAEISLCHDSNSPVVVFVRAGIGRTGTFIAMDYLLEQADTEKHIDVFKCVTQMRRSRINMVQTLVRPWYNVEHVHLLVHYFADAIV